MHVKWQENELYIAAVDQANQDEVQASIEAPMKNTPQISLGNLFVHIYRGQFL